MLEKPLLDDAASWKERFRAPTIYYTELASRDPDRGLAISNKTGVFQLHAWDVQTGELRQLTDRPKGTPFGSLSPDGRFVYYHDDREGNEIGHFVRIPFEGGEPEDVTPDMPPYPSWNLDLSHSGNRLGFMIATPDGFTAYCMDIGPNGTLGAPRTIFHSERLASGPVFSSDGVIAVVGSTERSGTLQYSLVALDAGTGERTGELWDGPDTSVELIGPAYFSPVADDFRLLATSNRTGVETLLLWNPRTGERTDLAFPGATGAMRPFDWSPDGRRILLRTFNQAIQQLYLYDLDAAKLRTLKPPAGVCVAPYFTPSGEIFAHWQDSTHPTELIALDGKSGVRLRSVLSVATVPPAHRWQSVSFPSTGGDEIQGWLGLPDGEGPFPAILEMHGGPQAVAAETFDPGSQAWLDHGFAFLTINFRGSTTFGKRFEEKIWGHPGDWEVDDMAAAHAWLVSQGIARPDQVFLTGASYGGYLTLHALGKLPDLWAGGMAVVAIADWALLYENAADTLRGYFRALFGGTPEEKQEASVASSPITHADRVRAPLLVIQGRNDTRCPSRQMEVYEAKMRSLGKAIEVHWFDAGHGTLEVERSIEHMEFMLPFAYRVLGSTGG
ncbi:MAG: prolyl oligopeptidase family serine peptidase [candidate division NC10 bacterium]